MPQWKPEDEALFAELCRRAEQQSREAAAPAPQGGGRGFCPHAACGGGRRRAAPGSFPNRAPCGPPSHPRSGNAAHPGGAGLFIALPRRPRAHLGAALYSAFLASLLKNETPDSLGNDTRIAPQNPPKEHRDPRAVFSARGSLFIASFSAAVPFPYRTACHFSYNTNHYIQSV